MIKNEQTINVFNLKMDFYSCGLCKSDFQSTSMDKRQYFPHLWIKKGFRSTPMNLVCVSFDAHNFTFFTKKFQKN